MPVLAIDLGGTKMATAIFSDAGKILHEEFSLLGANESSGVGDAIRSRVKDWLRLPGINISGIGICVPGIYDRLKGTVWAPNIPGWEAYPLLSEIKLATDIPAFIDNDRACYIMGECWQGASKGCTDAIFLAVGTGIAAGILVNGAILRGARDIAGAIGWMALDRPFLAEYRNSGAFESRASGRGIAEQAKKACMKNKQHQGTLSNMSVGSITAQDVFDAFEQGDEVAIEVINQAIALWGMAIANLVSLFNPQKIILGGGVFGPAIKLIPFIREEAEKWSQPISMSKLLIEASALGPRAGLYGSALLALENRDKHSSAHV